MADYTKLVPIIIKWETGVEKRGADFPHLFAEARRKGFANDPADTGGSTLCGITLSTFRTHYGAKSTVEDLKQMTPQQWLHIFKTGYWDRWMGDYIQSQPIANILIDWLWASGSWGIIKPQKLLGVRADGVVGVKTISALNNESPLPLFGAIKSERNAFIHHIVQQSVDSYERRIGRKATTSELLKHTYKRFEHGWLLRIDDFKYQ